MAYTDEYVRTEIRGQILKGGGFSVFWATANDKRARMLEEMSASGEIIYPAETSPFPWVKADIRKNESKGMHCGQDQ